MIGDIVLNRRREEVAISLDKTYRLAQGGEGEFTNVHPVNGDLAFGDVVEARDEVGEGRLAAPCRPDNAKDFTKG